MPCTSANPLVCDHRVAAILWRDAQREQALYSQERAVRRASPTATRQKRRVSHAAVRMSSSAPLTGLRRWVFLNRMPWSVAAAAAPVDGARLCAGGVRAPVVRNLGVETPA